MDYSTKSYPLANLEFNLISAKHIGNLLPPQAEGKLIVFSSGSLQYVQPEHLPLFFRALSSRLGIKVILLEPYDADVSLERIPWSTPRVHFSYTHSYKEYAEDAGFKTLELKLTTPEEIDPAMASQRRVGHYYWRGISPAS